MKLYHRPGSARVGSRVSGLPIGLVAKGKPPKPPTSTKNDKKSISPALTIAAGCTS